MAQPYEATVEITAKFIKQRFQSAEGFCIHLCELVDAPEYTFVTLVGNNLPKLPFPVTYSGVWENGKFGRQFKVEWVLSQLPQDTKDVEEFICSMRVGIGRKRIQKMLALTGPEKFWDTLANNPDVFLQVKGITKTTLNRLHDNVEALNHQKELLRFFHGDLKMTGARYKRLLKLYKDRMDDMLPDLRNNPFILQQIGIPFAEIDVFCAKNSNFAANDNRRLTAAAIQVLLDAQSCSHVGLPADMMPMKMRALLSHMGAVSLQECEMFLSSFLDSKYITNAYGMFYLTRAFAEEQFVVRTILKKLALPVKELSREEVDAELAKYGKARTDERGNPAPIILAPGQKDAVYTALTNRFCVITGGPGTGKSTILDAILHCWRVFNKDNDWVLMAPTGKAAVRMTQATGQSAGTIHSTLGLGVSETPLDPDAPSFHPAEVTKGLVIIDESSMLDLSVTTALLKAVKNPEQHLILVGDPDQLPSVGYGNVLADLIASNVVPVARLSTIYRQAAGNPIIINSAKMRDGNANLDWSHTFFKGWNQRSDEDNMRAACKHFMRLVNKLGIKNVVMLSPYHKKGAVSTNALNALLQEAFNPDKGRGSVKSMGQILRFGDRVMQLKNTETAVNGDVGTIQLVNETADDDEPCVVVKFDGTDLVKEYTRDELNQLELAYAMSVHKSQGSQYPAVVIVLPSECSPFLRRDLVYTGATRASKYVSFFGPMKTLRFAIENGNQDTRYTTMVPLLQHNAPKNPNK